MSDTAKHKPSESHTVDEVLKSLQDLIRNEALDERKPKAAPPPAPDPAVPRKRGRPRKVVIHDAAASNNPRRRSSASLAAELDDVLSSLNELVRTDLDGGTPAGPSTPPAVAPEPAAAAPESTGAPALTDDAFDEELQAAADALIVNDAIEPEREGDVEELTLEDMANAVEIDAAPPPPAQEEIVAAPPPPPEPLTDEALELPVAGEPAAEERAELSIADEAPTDDGAELSIVEEASADHGPELSIADEPGDTAPATPAAKARTAEPPAASPKKQLELKVIEPGEWKEPETKATETVAPPAAPAGKAESRLDKPAAPGKPEAKSAAPAPAKATPRPAPAGKRELKPEEPVARNKPETKTAVAPAGKTGFQPAQAPASKKPEAKTAAPAPAARTGKDKPEAARPKPAAAVPDKKTASAESAKPAPAARKPAPSVPEHDQETIDLGETDAVTDLIVSEATTVPPEKSSPASPQAAKPAPEPMDDPEFELTLEDPTRQPEPAAPVVDHEREKELNNLGLAEIDFSAVPEASSEQFAAFAASSLSPGGDDPPLVEFESGAADPKPPAGKSGHLSLDDNIPLLEDEVTPAGRGRLAPAIDPKRAREMAVRAIAKLNIELRKAGQNGLDVKTIQRLQALLREELEKAGKPGENTRPKK